MVAPQRFGRLLRWRFGLRDAPERRGANETRRKVHEPGHHTTIFPTCGDKAPLLRPGAPLVAASQPHKHPLNQVHAAEAHAGVVIGARRILEQPQTEPPRVFRRAAGLGQSVLLTGKGSCRMTSSEFGVEKKSRFPASELRIEVDKAFRNNSLSERGTTSLGHLAGGDCLPILPPGPLPLFCVSGFIR